MGNHHAFLSSTAQALADCPYQVGTICWHEAKELLDTPQRLGGHNDKEDLPTRN